MRRNARLARYAAPIAFLAAATVAILLVRSGLDNGDATPPPATTAATTTAADDGAGRDRHDDERRRARSST